MADNRKIIVLTGGGTAGHVTPNLALLPYLKEAGYKVYYFGSKNGIEKKLIADYEIPYFGISTGKLRRYFDVKNFTDPFRVIHGYREARKILKNIKPDVVFSKGGFVSVPVVRAARSLHIPCIIHESDMTPGLANKLCFSSASKICCNFPETLSKLPKGKAVLSGTPIRDEIFTGDREKGLALCGFTPDLPVIMIMGGSQGALAVNEAVRAHLDELLQDFQIIHLCGAGTDLIISRSGANAICEILALKIPNILVPLAVGSRGDQVLNAESFVSQGFSVLVPTDELNARIVDTVHQVYKDRAKYKEAMEKSSQGSAIPVIMDLIKNARKGR